MSARRAAWLTAGYYAAIFGALGAHLPYWPVWLEAWGLTTAEIGLYMSAALVARIFGTTVIPALADRWAVRRVTIAVTALATSLAHLAHLLVDTPAELMVATLIATIVMAPSVPLGEGLGLRAARNHGFGYARVRSAGSAAFLVSNVAIGALVGDFGPDVVLWFIVAGFGGVAVLGLVHPGGGARAGEVDTARPGETARLFLVPAVAMMTLAAVAGMAGHMVYYVYSVIDWRARGIDDTTIGLLWAFGVVGETALMLGPGRRLVERIGAANALAIGALAGIVRWSALALLPPVWMLWPLQGLHALTFALAHLGAMAFCQVALPNRLIAGVQGIKSGLIGGALAAGTLFLAGMIVARASIADAYWLSVGLAVVSLAASLALGRVWRGGLVSR